MVQYIWIGILSLNFCFNFDDVFAQKPYYGHYIKIGKSKNKSFLSIKEICIQDYRLFVEITKRKYGDTSEQYKFLIPDTAKFRALYGFPFFLPAGYSKNKETDDLLMMHWEFPMVAISYEQALAYCQWESEAWKQSKYVWQYSLPTQSNYESVLKKAKITKNKALSPFQRKGYNYVWGLTDNVAEYTQDGMVVEGGENTVLKFVEAKDCENPIGFRIKATKISKN